jgi:hypothetical protein
VRRNSSALSLTEAGHDRLDVRLLAHGATPPSAAPCSRDAELAEVAEAHALYRALGGRLG